MASDFDRRDFLKLGVGSLAGASVTSAASLGVAFGQTAAPLSFQLSWIKSIQYGGYFAGIEKGIFKKHGIEPTFNTGGPNIDAIANVASGQSMMGDRPAGPLVLARDKGMPIKIVATVFGKSPLVIMSPTATPIRNVRDLAGKTVAVPVAFKPIMLNVLKDAKVDLASVNIVPAAPDPSGLVTKQFDAYVGYSTNQGVMLQTKGVDVFYLTAEELGVVETTGTIYAREDFLAKNRDLVVRFLRAAAESWTWALENPEETAKLMVEKYGNPGLDYKAQLAEIKASKPYIATGAGKGLLQIDPAVYEKVIDQYRKADLVKSQMKASDLCDPSYVEAALS